MKKQAGPPQKTMLQALQDLRADGRTKSAAFYFLKSDFSMLQNEESFRRSYHGLVCCLQLLGPIHSDFQKSLMEMRKALDGFARQFRSKAADEAGFFQAYAKDLWYALLNTTRNYLPYENWYRFYKLGKDLFGKEH